MRVFAHIILVAAVLAADDEVVYRRMIAMTTETAPRSQCTYSPPPSNCETSCGAGNIPCVDETRCYNPDLGEMCCQNGTYCPRNTFCTDIGCCSVFYTLHQCGGHEIQEYKPPAHKSSTKGESTSTSSLQSSSIFISTSNAQPTSSNNPTDQDSDGKGVSKKTSAIIGGVIGGLAVIGAIIVAVVWVILRTTARTTATATPSVVAGEAGAYNSEFKDQGAYESGDSRRAVSLSVMGYYAPSPGPSSTLGSPTIPFYERAAPRRVTELDAEGIYRSNPTTSSTVDDMTSDLSELTRPGDTR
ncbi:hypothetical protein FQN49_002852 [Arthroderma sp. PD_2]|nr:hypothetical protein FQN49_002852 [Arthroderma sp. PD_2]